MAKERIHDLKQTSATFQARGVVFGMKKDKAYKAGDKWNVIEFGLNINNNKSIYIKLNGFTRDEVYYHKRAEKKGEKGDTKKVSWKDRKKCPGEGYRLIGVNISTGKDADGKNINEMFVEYDAVEYLRKSIKDGDSLFVKGNLVFSSFTDKSGQTKRKVELAPTQISYTQDPIDFDDADFAEMAEFENTLVFSGIEKEVDENDKHTGRFILSGYSIGYSTVDPVSFILDEEHAKLANNIKKRLKAGNSIKTYGRINVVSNVSAVESDDDGWGESSPMERLNTPVIREYLIYKADPATIDEETYTEAAIAKALKAIKNAKEASEKFVETADDGDTSGWGDGDDDSSENLPW